MAPMHVRYAREVPEYEIDPKELDFTDSVEITKVSFYFFFFSMTLIMVLSFLVSSVILELSLHFVMNV